MQEQAATRIDFNEVRSVDGRVSLDRVMVDHTVMVINDEH